jgi:hypothetical protein
MSNNGSNTSNAGGPTSMSNASRGVNGVSAGDWVRLKRLQGSRSNGYSSNGLLNPTSPIFNKDVAPTTSLQVPYGLPIHVFPVAGSSKIRRPASNWTDHIAFKNADVVFSKQASPDNATTVLTRYRLCDCTKTNLADKDSVCRRCLTRRPQGELQETNEGVGGGDTRDHAIGGEEIGTG